MTKLLRYGDAGRVRPAYLDLQGQIRCMHGFMEDIDLSTGTTLCAAAGLSFNDQNKLPIVKGDPTIAPPIANIGKIICIGLNYREHAAEAGLPVPDEPIVFFKPVSSLNGPYDDIQLLHNSRHTDWEVELAVVIGEHARYVPEPLALHIVAGYCIANDVSERKFQAKGTGQWILGKSGDTYCPLGPWLVTADEIADPQNLRLQLDVNGERMQDGSTADMIFPVSYLIHYVSQFMSLNPGDIICTGTPAGVGQGRNPPRFLRKGDRIRASIQGLGEQRNVVVEPR